MITGRDEAAEIRFLRKAEQIADKHTGFMPRVLERLELGDQRYGDQWLNTSIEDLLREAREEMVDGPAWLLLAVQRLQASEEVDVVLKAQIIEWARHWAACCAQADDIARRMLLALPDGL